MTEELAQIRRSGRRATLAGMFVIAALAGGGTAWGVLARVEGAVIGTGALVVEGNLKAVQHPAGGRVTGLLVAEGEHVAAGAPLLTLDDTLLRSELGIVELRLADARLRLGRLHAELAGTGWAPGGEAASELALHTARRDDLAGRRQQVREQIEGLRRGAEGLGPQRAARVRELGLVREELVAVRSLHEQGLVTLPRLTGLSRAEAAAEGALAQIDAQAATLAASVAEAEARLAQIDREAEAGIAREIREAEAEEAELLERRRALVAEIAATTVRAPVAGHVHQLAVHTVGGVVAPGQVMLSVVPEDARLAAEVMIPPAEIDRVAAGAPVHLRLMAGVQRLAPVLEATVSRVDRDAVTDAGSGESFYRLQAELPADAAGAAGVVLVAGMPVQGFVVTEARAPAEWLLAPLLDQVAHAWRER